MEVVMRQPKLLDIDPARVDVGMDTQTVVVPKVEVTPRKSNNP
jgi:hypothetical protein